MSIFGFESDVRQLRSRAKARRVGSNYTLTSQANASMKKYLVARILLAAHSRPWQKPPFATWPGHKVPQGIDFSETAILLPSCAGLGGRVVQTFLAGEHTKTLTYGS